MAKVLIIDDGNATRASKTRMYAMFAKTKGAAITNEKLQNLTDISGYDIILTDLDGTSTRDNQAFLDLLDAACQAGATPVVKMFSGRFSGVPTDLPVPIPPSLLGIVATYSDTDATKVITAAVSALAGSPSTGAPPGFP